MQFTVPTFPITPDLPRVEAALADLDPSALVDFDAESATLRLSTLLEPTQIAQALAAGGIAVDPVQVMRMPSECCGGCGG